MTIYKSQQLQLQTWLKHMQYGDNPAGSPIRHALVNVQHVNPEPIYPPVADVAKIPEIEYEGMSLGSWLITIGGAFVVAVFLLATFLPFFV